MRKICFGFLVLLTTLGYAQELNCTVSINAEQTGQANLQVFRTLKTQVAEFMNNTVWTDKGYKQQERINCNLVILVSAIAGDVFTASIQVQSSRPVYNATYNTTVFNYNDRDFNFRYTEFQPLNYNPNTFDSNLISVLAFYAYTIIGLDADTFSPAGGKAYFEEAKRIVSTAQQSGSPGWQAQGNAQNRYRLNNDLISPNFQLFHEIMYSYHRNGLDFMAAETAEAKEGIAVTLGLFEEMYNRRPNNYLTRVFFDGKAEEVANIFSGGPQADVKSLMSTLTKVAPTKSNFWQRIKF